MSSKIAHAGAFGRAVVGKGQSVAFTGTAGTISNAVGAQTQRVLVAVTGDAHIAFSQAGTAATTSDTIQLSADGSCIWICNPGEKVSAIQVSGGSGGTLYVSELA